MTDVRQVTRGYQQFVSPQAPPGMYFDAASGLIPPQRVRLASRGRAQANLAALAEIVMPPRPPGCFRPNPF